MSENLIEDLERAVERAESDSVRSTVMNSEDGRTIREVMYALEREFGAEAVDAQYETVKNHSQAWEEVRE